MKINVICTVVSFVEHLHLAGFLFIMASSEFSVCYHYVVMITDTRAGGAFVDKAW